MVAYDLRHLTQPDNQEVAGPIQDDEALVLFALIRAMRLSRVLEIGGLNGYSARNFLAALGDQGVVYTVDLNEVPRLAPNHVTIQRDARYISADDVDRKPIDLLFFDCHNYNVQMEMYRRLLRERVISADTVIALHDTNLHPRQVVPWACPIEDGWMHVSDERLMVNDFKRSGYDVFCFHTQMAVHSKDLPYRHGLTIARRFKTLNVGRQGKKKKLLHLLNSIRVRLDLAAGFFSSRRAT